MHGEGAGAPSRFVIAAYAFLALLVVPLFPHFVSPNEMSRWATAAALVDHRTFDITPFLPLLGGSAFEDASVSGGAVYSNKAPGATLLGVPAYAAARGVFGPPSAETMRATADAMRLLAATVPLLLLAWAMALAGAKLGATGERIGVTAFALLFATPLFVYGLLNFAHALTAAALFGAWVVLFVERREVAAGALIGVAVLSEYPCAIAGAVLVICAGRRALRVIAGGVPFAAALAIYNKLLFGSVFALSSGNERNAEFRAMASHGLFGIGLPDQVTLLRLLLDPARGLFVFAPIVLVALFALPQVRRLLPRDAFIALVGVPAALLVVYSGYPNWHGGWSVGPRYLAAAIPFVVFPLLFARATVIEAIALGASVAAVVPLGLTFPFPDLSFALPWSTFALPLLRDGNIAPNLLHLVWRPLALVVPPLLVVVAAVAALRGRAAVAAIGCAAMLLVPSFVAPAATPAVSPAAGRLSRAGAGVAAGDTAGQRPALRELTRRLRVGYVEEVYFEQRGAMSRAVGGLPVPPRAAARARAEAARPPTSWPF